MFGTQVGVSGDWHPRATSCKLVGTQAAYDLASPRHVPFCTHHAATTAHCTQFVLKLAVKSLLYSVLGCVLHGCMLVEVNFGPAHSGRRML